MRPLLKEGDKITVKLLEIDPKTGKYKLSHRVLIPKPEGYVDRERRPRPERGERGERGERRGGNNHNNEHRHNNNGERPSKRKEHHSNNNRNEEYHDPMANREPRDFNDSLDHGSEDEILSKNIRILTPKNGGYWSRKGHSVEKTSIFDVFRKVLTDI